MSNEKTKSLLSEAAVRRFMKLAELDSVASDSFVSDLFFEEEEAEETDEGPMGAGEMEVDLGEPPADMGDMDGGEEPGAGMPAPQVSPEVADAVAASIMTKVGEVLADELGADVEVMDGEGDMGDMGDMGGMDADPAPMAPEDEDADPVGEPMEDEMMQEDETEGHQGGDLNDDLVNEVARRVAARLMGKAK